MKKKNTTKMINIVYGLRDPRNDVYQYIGKSTVGINRPLQHLKNSHSTKVNKWVKELEDNWLYPRIEIIEEVDNIDELATREKFWINYYYDINPNLLNICSIQIKNKVIRSDEDEDEFNHLIRIVTQIPKMLKNERLCRKLTQNQMAKYMNVSRSTISLCEGGKNVNFDFIKKYVLTLKGIDLLTNVITDRART
jgi:predicted XRE-type DNA-binding protein